MTRGADPAQHWLSGFGFNAPSVDDLPRPSGSVQ